MKKQCTAIRYKFVSGDKRFSLFIANHGWAVLCFSWLLFVSILFVGFGFSDLKTVFELGLGFAVVLQIGHVPITMHKRRVHTIIVCFDSNKIILFQGDTDIGLSIDFDEVTRITINAFKIVIDSKKGRFYWYIGYANKHNAELLMCLQKIREIIKTSASAPDN